MGKFITSFIILSICAQAFPAEDKCQLTLISSSNTFALNRNHEEKTSVRAKIQRNSDHFLKTIESLNLEENILSFLWEKHIYYIVDLVSHTSGQLIGIGMKEDSIIQIRKELLKKGLSLGMQFDSQWIQDNIDEIYKKQKELYQKFIDQVENIPTTIDRGEFKERLHSALKTLKHSYLYRHVKTENILIRHIKNMRVFEDIEWQLKDDRQLPHHRKSLRHWILEEVEIIMDKQGVNNQYET